MDLLSAIMPGISLAVEQYTQSQTSRDPYANAKKQVQVIIDNALKQLDRKRQSLERSLRPAGEVDALRRSGEWLLAYAYQVQPGQKTLVVEEDVAGEKLEIALDPALTAPENAQQYFDRYNRAKKAAQ